MREPGGARGGSRRPRRLTVLALAAAAVAAGCGDPLSPVPVERWATVVTGGDHSCALSADGEAYCWGRGGNAETGIGQAVDVNRPLPVDTNRRFVALTAGLRHTCALQADGTAECWGWNGWGQLGVGRDVGALHRPNTVATDARFVALSAGWYHTCGLTTDGALLCWGLNSDGQLGTGTGQDSALAPVPVALAESFSALGAGGFHTCGVAASGPDAGRVHCWGRNTEGQLGTGDTEPRSVPSPIVGSSGYRAVSAGRAHTCAITADGAREIHCWGANGHGQLGARSFGQPGLPGSTGPVRAHRDVPFATVSAGLDFTCATDTAQQGYCWGAGAAGQLGVATVDDLNRPSHMARRPFEIIAAAEGTHACGVAPDGALYCWGSGLAGQLGHHDITFTAVPVEVPRVR